MTFLIFLIIFISLVFIKYIIDTKSTIKELTEDRNKYRTIAWKSYIGKDSGPKLNWLYLNLKKQISTLIDDLKDTDFNDANIKNDIIAALDRIDQYSDIVENEDADSLKHYRGN